MKQYWSAPYVTEIEIKMTQDGEVPKRGSAEDAYTSMGMGTGDLPG